MKNSPPSPVPSVSLSLRPSISPPLLLLLSATLALAATGCSRTTAEPVATTTAPATIAAHYKAGHGVQLSPAARAFVGLATAEFNGRLPATAILRTVKGDFVYVANGDWFLRTPVKLGAADNASFTLKDGLYDGDTVVTQGARALWLAELQATNGGVGCADGH